MHCHNFEGQFQYLKIFKNDRVSLNYEPVFPRYSEKKTRKILEERNSSQLHFGDNTKS